MAVTVRVKNFQSIKDAELKISGLTVITGPNNSGKTAFLRAIRGLFTNAPSGPLVRQGEQNLSVYMMFDDGNSVFWEKGKVNQYTVNGKTLSSVGRGVPPEVEALGVREISAGSEKIWPQVARQFDGTLFLVDRPGATMAEALSDVERVEAGDLVQHKGYIENHRTSALAIVLEKLPSGIIGLSKSQRFKVKMAIGDAELTLNAQNVTPLFSRTGLGTNSEKYSLQ
jgi:energy-coupling factor transporter ATP-binding protein EcfA2